jgi:hypothetical protein
MTNSEVNSKTKLFVLMGNDYPSAIIQGTQEEAEELVKVLQAAPRNNREGYTKVYWRPWPFPVRSAK